MSSKFTSNQDYGADPIAVRDTNKYVDEYIGGFVEKWDELIDWKSRARSEGDFFITNFERRGPKESLMWLQEQGSTAFGCSMQDLQW